TADGNTLAAGSTGGIIKLWDLPSGRERWTSLAHRGHVWNLAFAPDGRTLASVGRDGFLKLWHTATGQELFALPGDTPHTRAQFSPDGRTLYAGTEPASGNGPATVRVWRADPARR